MKKRHQDTIKTTASGQKENGFHPARTIGNAPQKIVRRIKAILLTTGATLLAFILLAAFGQHPTLDFALLIAAMAVLCGLVSYDISSRRAWERDASSRIDALTRNHDSLVREAARNRGDITALKEGLGDVADFTRDQLSENAPQDSTGAGLIGALAGRLGALGEKAPALKRPPLSDPDILELQIAPPPQRMPPPANDRDPGASSDPGKYTDTVVAELLHHAIANDRIDLFMQPVVALPQRKPRMYEVFGRLRAKAGTYLPAARYLDVARMENVLSGVDNITLVRSLEILQKRGFSALNTPLVINVSAASLMDRKFMGDLVAFLSKNRSMAKNLVFELPQEEIEGLDQQESAVMDGLSRLGCAFSMDRVRNRQIDIAMMRRHHVRYIKMDAAWLLQESRSEDGFSRIANIKKHLDAAGIDLILERIESEDALRELLDFNIDLGQGYLFGKPDHAVAYTKKDKVA